LQVSIILPDLVAQFLAKTALFFCKSYKKFRTMGNAITEHRNKSPFSHLSIRKRLPLLICILLLILVLAFSLASYLGVKNASLVIGEQRLKNLSDQLSAMLGQSAQAITANTKAAANGEPVKKYIQSGETVSDTAALGILQKLRTDSTWVSVQLLNNDFKPLLESKLPGINMQLNLDSVIASSSLEPGSCKIGNLISLKDSVFYPVIASVEENNHTIGYLLKWKYQKASPKSLAQFSGLLGANAALIVGNADGTLWTDLIKVVPAPTSDFKKEKIILQYSRPAAGQVIAMTNTVANTPWIIVLEISRRQILEPANRFLRWVIITGIVLMIAGILIAWWMSQSITQPLKELTTATSAMAAGDYTASVAINRSDELGDLARSFNTMTHRVNVAHLGLEKKVRERTAQLEKSNKELEAFSYSVSHDLRAPLRAISGFAGVLKEDYGTTLDAEANRIIDKIIRNGKMMGQLIDDLIAFSKLGRKELTDQQVNMKALVDSCLAELLPHYPEIDYHIHVSNLPLCIGDEGLLKQVWMNLISNALKYSSKNPHPAIEIGWKELPSGAAYYIKDNGVGFDMQYSGKLFGVFQRLHSDKEFEGTGVGLALAKRIINQHHGEIWAKASLGEGAIFYFSLTVVTAEIPENTLI
jgi:signal transduction histidine kinase